MVGMFTGTPRRCSLSVCSWWACMRWHAKVFRCWQLCTRMVTWQIFHLTRVVEALDRRENHSVIPVPHRKFSFGIFGSLKKGSFLAVRPTQLHISAPSTENDTKQRATETFCHEEKRARGEIQHSRLPGDDQLCSYQLCSWGTCTSWVPLPCFVTHFLMPESHNFAKCGQFLFQHSLLNCV